MNDLKASLVEYFAPAIPRLITGLASPNLARPYVIMQFISSNHIHHMLGSSGFATRRVQFDIYGDTSPSVEATFEALRNDLDGFIGMMGVGDNTTQILSSWLESERDSYVDPIDASRFGKHRRTVDFLITHRTTVPEET